MHTMRLNLNAESAEVSRTEACGENKPGNVNVHWRLAQLYREMGRKEEASAEFEKAKVLTKAADERSPVS